MKYSFKKINIEAPFPTKQCGHLAQTFLVNDFKDHLFGRVFAFKDETSWVFHISLDLLAFPFEYRNDLQKRLQEKLGREIVVITSTTHTHYSHDVTSQKYLDYLLETLTNEIVTMNYQEMGEVFTSYQIVPFHEVGKSRITGYESNNEYLVLIRFFQKEECFLNWIIYNCHPTTLPANSNFFSSEYPGYLLNECEKLYQQDFTFSLGASGDISTRFTRKSQDYNAMVELANKLKLKVEQLLQQESTKQSLKLEYHQQEMKYEYDFSEIVLPNTNTERTNRELETIEIGKQVRQELAQKHSFLSFPLTNQIFAWWNLGSVKLIFFPNEIFSTYLNEIDLTNTYLCSYSNGYGPYILPINFPYITYEMFVDTTTKKTKEMIVKLLRNV